MPETVRIGIVGAGSFTKSRILPGFQKLPGCAVTVVANRSRASSEKVAAEFGIPAVADDWRQVVSSASVDAVFIGTPPYAHCEVTLAALAAGKHVLCETRIALSTDEAREMEAAAAKAKQQGVQTMLVPPAPFYRGRRFVAHLVKSGYLGKLRQVLAFNLNASMADASTPLSVGRNDIDMYGRYNTAQLGLTYDVMTPWTGHATRVLAQRATFVSERPRHPGGPLARAPYPEEVAVIAETEGGALQMNLLNWAVYFGDTRVELYGDQGTLVYRSRGDQILAARAGEDALQPLPIPPEHDSPWLVEEEFVALVRGDIDQPSFGFGDGVRNMAYLEAAYLSGTEGRWVEV